jgi:hypothetical protein
LAPIFLKYLAKEVDMRKWISVVSILLCLAFLTGYKLPEMIRMVAGGVGGTQYMLGTALTPTLEKYLGSKVRVMPMEVIRERFVVFRMGKAELGCVSFANFEMSITGTEQFAGEGDGPQQMRMMWYLFDVPFGYIVRGNSDIKTFADVKGKRVAWPVFSPTMQAGVLAMLEIAGLTKNDVTLVPLGNIGALYRSVGEGKSDISYCALTSSATYETEAMPHGLRVLGIPIKDKRAWEIFLQYSPIAIPAVLGAEGIASSKGIEGPVSPYGLAAHASIPDDLVYQVMKVMWDRYDEYKGAHRYLQYGTPQAQREWLGINPLPCHPGAIKLLKEKGVWTAEDTKNNDQALALTKKWEETWAAAVKKAKDQKIKIATTNKEWMELWEKEQSKVERFKIRLK